MKGDKEDQDLLVFGWSIYDNAFLYCIALSLKFGSRAHFFPGDMKVNREPAAIMLILMCIFSQNALKNPAYRVLSVLFPSFSNR